MTERTVVVRSEPGADRAPERRRRTSGLHRSDVLAVAGAGAAALAATTLLFTQLAPLSGRLGFVLVAFALFLGLYALLVSFDEPGPTVRDRLAAAVVHALAAVLVSALIVVIGYTLLSGAKALAHWNFFTDDMSDAGPLDGLDVGGVLHATVGTLEQIAIALAVTVPLGLACAVCLTELPGRFSLLVRTLVESMTALPSIVCGLFVYATLILTFGFGKSGLAASIALSVMMLPVTIRAADVVLRLVPGSLREASLALGASHWRTVWHVVLPTARSGLTTAVILGTARGIGETAPVLLTAGYTASLNANPLSGPQVSLPLATFEFVKSPQQAMVARGFGTAATLLFLVLFLFLLARAIGGRGPGHVGRRARRRIARGSARDAHRFAARAASGRNR